MLLFFYEIKNHYPSGNVKGTYNKHEGYALQEVNGFRGKVTVEVLFNPSIVKNENLRQDIF